MSLWKIAWRSMQRRALASALTALSMALGVMLIVAVLLILGVVSESFRTNASLGYNLIIGPDKGGRLQLVLNTVYYLSTPLETLPYSYYQEFLGADQRGDGRDGKYHLYTQLAIPVCLGDYYEGYRVVGTTTAMFDDLVYDRERGRKYTFAKGRNFQHKSKEYGFFEGVLGAAVARQTGLKVGDTFSPTHGAEGPEHDEFHVVGILKPTGTPNDRGVFINIEGFYLLEGHAKPVEPDAENNASALSNANGSASKDVASAGPVPSESHSAEGHEAHAVDRLNLEPLPVEQREVTAILLSTVNALVTPGLRNTINEGTEAQAVLPVSEIYQLFTNIVTPIQAVLLVLAIMVCVVSGVSILVSIYNSMSDRRHELAVMRALGAGRRTVMCVVLLESVMLSVGGGLLGWAAGHVLVGGLAQPLIEERTGVTVGILDLAPTPQFLEILAPNLMNVSISSELLLVPGLILLAVVVGFMPALAAYRTDVAKALTSTP